MTTQQPSSRLRPFQPTSFGRYTLLLPLATGGMGEIYLARIDGAPGFEKLCVIKKILPQLAVEKDFVDRFVHEARTLVQLSHGAIAQVLDMGLEDSRPFLALEYVDGKDLRKVHQRARERGETLPLPVTLWVMGRVLDALAYAHRKRDAEDRELNLVHRDISPQNVLVSYEGEVKVIDFGLAKSTLTDQKTNPHAFLGKFLYMSPEQARHQPVDRRSDLYAVGLCLYELISGRHPYESASGGDLVARVSQPMFLPLSSVSPQCPAPVAELVHRALQVSPDQRFQSAEEFRGQLLKCLQELDPSAGPEGLSRYMRESFQAEYQLERKTLASVREAARSVSTPRPAALDATDKNWVGPAPSSPAAAPHGDVDATQKVRPGPAEARGPPPFTEDRSVTPDERALTPRDALDTAQTGALRHDTDEDVPVHAKPTSRLPGLRPGELEGPPRSRGRSWLWLTPLLALLATLGSYVGYDLLVSGARSGGADVELATRSPAAAPQAPRLSAPAPAPDPEGLPPLPSPPRAGSEGKVATAKPTAEAARPARPVHDEGELLVPLPPPPPVAPKAQAKPPRRRPVLAPADKPPLIREWMRTKGAFLRLQRKSSCDAADMAILCVRYRELSEEIDKGNGTRSDEELLARVRELGRLVQGKTAGP